MNFIYVISLGFDKYRCSSWEKALKKGREMQSPLTKVAIQPLDTDDPNRVVVCDITTFQTLCSTKGIDTVLKNLAE